MADLTITAASVRPGSTSTSTLDVTYGAAVTQGQPVYDGGDGKHYPCDADDTAAKAEAKGIALTPGGDGQRGIVATKGPVVMGATLTVGEIYVLSGTAGGVAPEGDLATGDYVTILGVATDAATIQIGILASGVQVPA